MSVRHAKLIVCKLGLDAHDNGLQIVSKWLADEGYEVVYAGLYNSPHGIVQMVIKEGADAIGVGFLGGEHVYYTRKLLAELKDNDLAHVRVIIGGVIPPDDVGRLRSLGADAIFTPGTPRETILRQVGQLFERETA